MTEADIYTVLKDLAGGQVYPYVAPAGTAPPWVVFLLPSETTADTLGGTAESTASVQVDVYADTLDDARAIRRQALSALKPLGIGSINNSAGYEPDTRLYRTTLDARIIT